MFNHHIDVLESGLKLIRVPMPGVKSVTALFLVNAGSRYEQPENSGLAHALEHLVFKGTKKYPDQKELATLIDSLGADSNAFTAKEYTGYYLTIASKHLPKALEILKELVFFPLLRETDLEAEKRVIIEEIKMHEDDPPSFISSKFEQMTYQVPGLANDISGTVETVSNLSKQKLVEFRQNWYQLGNISLILAGDADKLLAKDLTNQVSELINAQSVGLAGGKKEIDSFLADDPWSDKRFVLEKRDTAQAHFTLGWPSIKRGDPKRYALTILSVILGGNRSSRLFQEVRQKKSLAYYVYSDTDQYHEAGLLGAQAGVNTDETLEALKTTIKVFTDLADGTSPVTAEEMERAKDYVTGKMTLSLENSKVVSRYYGLKDLLWDEVEDPEEAMQKLQAVSLEEVTSLAQEIVKPGELRLGLIGPFEDEAKFKELI